MPDELNKTALTSEDVAAILKIARNTVYELIKRGELNCYKVGRKVRFTMADVETYIKNSRLAQAGGDERPQTLKETNPSSGGFIICGQDVMLDVLSNYLSRRLGGFPILRAYIGSYNGLAALYRGEVQAATAHLWDGDTGEYNVPYVRRLLPGVRAEIIGLTWRVQGFYVAKGNPENIRSWSDLTRPGLRMVNREKGAGSRVLLDEQLRLLHVFGRSIEGYDVEVQSHHAVASAVGRGEAQVGVGHQKAAEQVENVDFIPLQKERYDLVVKKEDADSRIIGELREILRSESFKREFAPMAGYDLECMGRMIAET